MGLNIYGGIEKLLKIKPLVFLKKLPNTNKNIEIEMGSLLVCKVVFSRDYSTSRNSKDKDISLF